MRRVFLKDYVLRQRPLLLSPLAMGQIGGRVGSLRSMASFRDPRSFSSFRDLVVYEDTHLLVANKPGGCLTQGDSTGDESLFAMAKKYLALERGKDLSSVYLALVHRLDRVSSGVVVFGKTSKAASRLSEQVRNVLISMNGLFL